MKKLIAFLSFLVITIIVSSCTWEIPQTVNVKTDATYNFCIGTLEKDFSENFSATSIISGASGDQGIEIYDYYPGKTDSQVQKFLMKIQVQDIPIDFTQYFNDTSLASGIKAMSFEQNINIPVINMSVNEDIPLTEALNAAISGTADAGKKKTITFSTSTLNFSNVKYDSGQMVISCDKASAGTVILYDSTGTEIQSGTMIGTECNLDLSNITLEGSGMKLTVPQTSGSVNITILPISKINKINASSFKIDVSLPVETGTAANFGSCVVGEGSFSSTYTVPAGVTVKNTSATFSNAVTNPAENKTTGSGTIFSTSINGATIKPGTATISNSVDFEFDNADLSSNSSANVSFVSNIKSYQSIALTLSDVKTKMDNPTQSISQTMINTIQQIDLANSGLKGTFINTLPQGNDITLVGNSNFIGLVNSTSILSAGTAESKEFEIKSGKNQKVIYFVDADKEDVTSDKFNKIDFNVNIGLPGASTETPNQINIQNVKPNETYEIKISLEPDINWNTVSLYSEGVKTGSTISTGLNVDQIFSSFSSVMGSDFDGKVSLEKLPIYLYTVKPNMDCFDTAQFTGNLKMFYGVSDGNGGYVKSSSQNSEIVFLDSDGSDETKKAMNFVAEPVFEKEEDVITSDITSFSPSSSGDIATLCKSSNNDANSSLCVSYELQFKNENAGNGKNTFTISHNDYSNSSGGSSSIAIMAFIEIPLNFSLTEDVGIDILSTIASGSSGDDLLGRTEEPSQESQSDFLAAIRSAKINYTSSALPFYGVPDPVRLELDWDGATESRYETQKLSLEGGSINLTDIADIMSIYPLKPSVLIIIPQGTFSIPRNIKLAANISLSIEMDPTYKMTILDLNGGSN